MSNGKFGCDISPGHGRLNFMVTVGFENGVGYGNGSGYGFGNERNSSRIIQVSDICSYDEDCGFGTGQCLGSYLAYIDGKGYSTGGEESFEDEYGVGCGANYGAGNQDCTGNG